MHKGIWWDKPKDSGEDEYLIHSYRGWSWDNLQRCVYGYSGKPMTLLKTDISKHTDYPMWFKECKLILPEEFLVIGGKH